MKLREIKFEAGDLSKVEKVFTFSSGGKEVDMFLHVNPWNGKLVASVKHGGDFLVENKYVLVSEWLLDYYGLQNHTGILDFDVIFLYYDETEKGGFLANYKEIGTKVGLFYYEGGNNED
ncbi:MAG: hypothetical protein ACRC0G_14660 [Fusobacteriaceae bacterium]